MKDLLRWMGRAWLNFGDTGEGSSRERKELNEPGKDAPLTAESIVEYAVETESWSYDDHTFDATERERRRALTVQMIDRLVSRVAVGTAEAALNLAQREAPCPACGSTHGDV